MAEKRLIDLALYWYIPESIPILAYEPDVDSPFRVYRSYDLDGVRLFLNLGAAELIVRHVFLWRDELGLDLAITAWDDYWRVSKHTNEALFR